MDLDEVRFVGLDLAKRVFSVQLQTAHGRDLGGRSLARDELVPFFASLPSSVVAMEACAGAGYWCEVLASLGHTPLPLHARAVARLRMGPKNDKKDAALILLAARLPDARAVLVKSRDQMAALSLHRMRELVLRHEMACANQVLSFLLEMGSVRWRSATELRRASDEDVSAEIASMPLEMQFTIRSSLARLRAAHAENIAIKKALLHWHSCHPRSLALASVPGIGYGAATALAASIPDPPPWTSGRAFSAYLGLVPVQRSSGDVTRLGRIGRGGDQYLRRALFLAGRSAAMLCFRMKEGPSSLVSLLNRKHFYVAASAHAARLARTSCQMLIDGTQFQETAAWRHVPFSGRTHTPSEGRGKAPNGG
ncbi:IS110 family transposase [Roseateles sp. MS654]|uniref:IS110 family transposase n=1 Tax=Roseateles sp. MS654 TaxID=3412685 RepID=UPI003C30EB08